MVYNDDGVYNAFVSRPADADGVDLTSLFIIPKEALFEALDAGALLALPVTDDFLSGFSTYYYKTASD